MLKVSQAVPACPSDKDRMKVKTLGCWVQTERRGPVVKTPTSNLGGSSIKSRPGDRLLWVSFVVFLSPSRQIPGYHLRLGHDRFLPNTFQFIIQLSSFHSTLYDFLRVVGANGFIHNFNKRSWYTTIARDISGSHGEDYSLLEYSAVKSRWNRRFRSAFCLHHQAIMMEAVHTSETSVYFDDTILRYTSRRL
jgi:hypothetical protein